MSKIDPSYKKVNYLLRLRKQIERKIFIDILLKIEKFPRFYTPLRNYLYFGLGSIYYADFILFHKFLGITDMLSVDYSEEEQRFKFNKPYNFIKFERKLSTKGLEKIYNSDELRNEQLLIWLDYDRKFARNYVQQYMLDDLSYVGKLAKKYDIFIVTIECWESRREIDSFFEKIDSWRQKDLAFKSILEVVYKKYKKSIETMSYRSKEIKPEELSTIILGDIIRKYIQDKIGGRDLHVFQIFHFYYKDTAPMYSFGCIFVPEDDRNMFKGYCKDKKITIYNDGAIPEKIDCPIITPKEKYFIDSYISIKDGEEPIIKNKKDIVTKIGLGEYYIERYRKYYKYYPQFFEALY